MINKKDKSNERPRGISAFIIVEEDIKWLGPSIESIMPLCDEILVLPLKENEDVEKIVNNFTAQKIKKLEKPEIKIDNCSEDGYYRKCREWAIKNTKYSHLCEWGANMLLIQEHISDDLYDWMTANYFIKFRGYNITFWGLNKISREKPYTKMKTRIFKAKELDKKNKKQILFNKILKSQKIKEPIYLDTTKINNKTKNDIKINLELPNFFFKKPEQYIK